MLTHLESPERSAGLRTLYKQLAKQLHPDANPGLTDEQKEIWHLVQQAYEKGDFEKLKALQIVYEKEITQLKEQELELDEEHLSLRNNALQQGIRLLNEEIKVIRNEFPFTIESQIKDEVWVEEQATLIKKEIYAMDVYEKELLQYYTDLINSHE